MALARDLRLFGDNVISPSEDVTKSGHKVLGDLVKLVAANSKYPIARVAKNGSVGKKTAIRIKIDFDCLFFIDPDALPMARYDEFLSDVEDILTLNCSFSNDRDIHVSKSAVSFFYKGFYFDFLPAPFAKGAGSGASVEDQLKYRIRHPIKNNGDERHFRGDQALAEGAVIFFKEQSAFVHCLARLLKWWSISVYVPGFFNGRSFRMELFAVMAADEEGNDDVLRGFRIALDKIRCYRNVHVIWDRFYDRSLVPEIIASERPLLLDPANPRNNLLGKDVSKYFDQLASYANVTLQRLDVSERCDRLLPDLFDAQPSVWSGLAQKPLDDSWIVGAKQLPEEKQPRVVAQKPHANKRVLEVAAHVLAASLARNGSGAVLTEHDVAAAIGNMFIGSKQSWVATNRRFEDCDVLAIFPAYDEVGTCFLAGFNVEQAAS